MIVLDPRRTTPEDTAYWLGRGPFAEATTRADPSAEEVDVVEHPTSATAWTYLETRHGGMQ